MSRMLSPLDIAIAAAAAGGAVLESGLGRTIDAHAKENSRTSLVTSIDLRSQEAIVRVILNAYPDHAIVGEEGHAGNRQSESVWFVDPLDGTTNYVHGLPFCCVSIAHCDPHGLACGVVYDPVRKETFAAARGQGATHNGRSIRVSDTRRLCDSVVSTQIQSDDPIAIDRFATRARRFVSAARALRVLGAPALALAYVACGRLDAFCEPDMSPWDTLAGSLIIAEAGGRISTFSGAARSPHPHSSIVGSNAKLHDELLAILEVEEGGLPANSSARDFDEHPN